jgi:hypothetical protein
MDKKRIQLLAARSAGRKSQSGASEKKGERDEKTKSFVMNSIAIHLWKKIRRMDKRILLYLLYQPDSSLSDRYSELHVFLEYIFSVYGQGKDKSKILSPKATLSVEYAKLFKPLPIIDRDTLNMARQKIKEPETRRLMENISMMRKRYEAYVDEFLRRFKEQQIRKMKTEEKEENADRVDIKQVLKSSQKGIWPAAKQVYIRSKDDPNLLIIGYTTTDRKIINQGLADLDSPYSDLPYDERGMLETMKTKDSELVMNPTSFAGEAGYTTAFDNIRIFRNKPGEHLHPKPDDKTMLEMLYPSEVSLKKFYLDTISGCRNIYMGLVYALKTGVKPPNPLLRDSEDEDEKGSGKLTIKISEKAKTSVSFNLQECIRVETGSEEKIPANILTERDIVDFGLLNIDTFSSFVKSNVAIMIKKFISRMTWNDETDLAEGKVAYDIQIEKERAVHEKHGNKLFHRFEEYFKNIKTESKLSDIFERDIHEHKRLPFLKQNVTIDIILEWIDHILPGFGGGNQQLDDFVNSLISASSTLLISKAILNEGIKKQGPFLDWYRSLHEKPEKKEVKETEVEETEKEGPSKKSRKRILDLGTSSIQNVDPDSVSLEDAENAVVDLLFS